MVQYPKVYIYTINNCFMCKFINYLIVNKDNPNYDVTLIPISTVKIFSKSNVLLSFPIIFIIQNNKKVLLDSKLFLYKYTNGELDLYLEQYKNYVVNDNYDNLKEINEKKNNIQTHF